MNDPQVSDTNRAAPAAAVANAPAIVDEPAVAQLNRDPLSGAPGAHPMGTALGSASAAAAGAAVGALFGPIGFLIGGTLGAIAGGAAGHAVAEHVDPTAEVEFWRGEWRSRSYFDPQLEYEQEYAPAFLFGVQSYGWLPMNDDGRWDRDAEQRLAEEWERARGGSTLSWAQARQAVQDAWQRSHETHKTYAASDEYWRSHAASTTYFRDGLDFERDYRMAYRYGTYARSRYFGQRWSDALEAELKAGWPGFCGACTLSWELALPAIQDGFNHADQLGIAQPSASQTLHS